MKELKILIKDDRKKVVLETTSNTYEKDLLDNKDKLKIWWTCWIEYVSDDTYGDYIYNSDGTTSYHELIDINDRPVLSDYNFSIEGERNVYKDVLEYLNYDLKSTKTYLKTYKDTKQYKSYMKETSKPSNTNIKPVSNNLVNELVDND